MKTILILAIGFLPNIGGLETHLKDLVDELIKDKWKVIVLTYQPLHTPVLGKWIEKNRNLVICRLPVLRGLFYKLLKIPFLEFIFLEPLLFLFTPLILLKNPEIKVINGQGLIAGFSASFWSRIFKKRFVVSAQSVYRFPKRGLYRKMSRWIFKSSDRVVAISAQSAESIKSLGVLTEKIQLYTNWENSRFFIPIDRSKAKKQIGFSDQFIVSFFGRLVEEKGIRQLLESLKFANKKIKILVYGEGPLLELVLKAEKEFKNLVYMKTISPNKLPLHYSAADIVIMPSVHEEGFGRVAAGALLCGTPVIASNRGALPEVVNNSVGKVIKPISTEIAKAMNYFFLNRKALMNCGRNARKYAMNKFSERNARDIIYSFQEQS